MFLLILYTCFFARSVYVAQAEIEILNQGIDNIEEDDIALIFYITVKNVCKDNLELSVNMLQCCETINSDEADCNGMTLIGGDMGVLPSTYVKNLTLIYPNIYLFNRRGMCSIEVIYRNQLKKKEISTDIHFDTTKFCPEAKQKPKGCETVDLDIKQNCNPADCLIKYSGTISYFNPECKLCQKVPVCNSKTEGCNPDTAYSPYNNECGDLNIPISKEDLEDIEKGSSDGGQLGTINAICHFGTVTDNGECVCYEGWTTATNDEGMYEPSVAQHHLCNIQVGDWNCVNKSRIRITAILIAIFAVTVISKVLLLMCVMTWCYRHFRKPEKTCAQDLDPDDKSILLCEELESFDKCLCELVQTESKPKQLHAQTVNVNYYSCSPSAFTSVKSITISSKGSPKTEQTVEFSNSSTSAAISFPASSDETDNTNESVLCEDVGNEVAYGVFCRADENNEEEEEIEEEEEEDEEDDDDDDDDDCVEEEQEKDNKSTEVEKSE